MIKFFRNIRKNLLSEGKTGKYLKYAIGEIFLVVIGILIALQVNNLNEQRKAEATRQGYYYQILEDLSKDKIYIEETISLLDSTINSYHVYLETYKEPDLNFDQAFNNILLLDIKSKVISFNTNTIESLESTGDIKLIPTAIRNKLIDLKRYQNRMIKASDANREKAGDILKLASLESGGDLYTRLSNQSKLREVLKLDSKLEDVFLMLEAFQQWKIVNAINDLNSFKEILSDEDDLVNLVNEELKI